jgi:aminoglycoside phosphotransferase
MRIPGKTLYDKQEQDYYDLLREQKSLMKNIEELPFETCPIVMALKNTVDMFLLKAARPLRMK